MRQNLILGGLLGVALSVTGVRAIEVELLAQLPATTRVLLLIQPETLRSAPEIAALIHSDVQLDGTWAHEVAPARVARIAIAYVATGEKRERVVLTLGKAPWSQGDLDRVRGPKRGTTSAGAVIRAHRNVPGAAWFQASPRCIVEGRLEILALFAGASTQQLDGLASDKPAARLLAESDADWPAAVVYVSPDDAVDMHSILQELDRTLGFGMEPLLGSYKTALRMLGNAHGLRVALRQDAEEYEAGVAIAMPNRMAAQIASVSLEAGAGMAQTASDAAVRAGKMSRADASAMAAVLATLRSRSDGDLVRVTVVMRDSTSGAP